MLWHIRAVCWRNWSELTKLFNHHFFFLNPHIAACATFKSTRLSCIAVLKWPVWRTPVWWTCVLLWEPVRLWRAWNWETTHWPVPPSRLSSKSCRTATTCRRWSKPDSLQLIINLSQRTTTYIFNWCLTAAFVSNSFSLRYNDFCEEAFNMLYECDKIRYWSRTAGGSRTEQFWAPPWPEKISGVIHLSMDGWITTIKRTILIITPLFKSVFRAEMVSGLVHWFHLQVCKRVAVLRLTWE